LSLSPHWQRTPRVKPPGTSEIFSKNTVTSPPPSPSNVCVCEMEPL